MKKNKFQAVLSLALGALGLSTLPKGEDGKLALDADQEATLKGTFTANNFEAFKKVANEILAEEAGLESQREEANALLAGVLNQPEATEAPIEQNAASAAQVIENQREQISTLMNQPEPDAARTPLANAARGLALVAALTSSTHLFGATDKAMSFDGRSWNRRAAQFAKGNTQAAVTDFTDASTITRLNDDLKEYYIQNPTVLRDLAIDNYGLPSFWPKRFGVLDMISDAVMDVANVTQARKPDWTPGAEFFIGAEKRKIYRVQIDLEYNGYQLQELETSWLNTLYNFDGSSPYKYSFVAFLVSKIDKQARLEDRIAAINGIYVEKPAGIESKGDFLNRQNGLRHQIYFFRDVLKKVQPYVSPLGQPTSANMVDYVRGMVDSLPLMYKNKQGLKFYMSPTNKVRYNDSHKLANALHNDYTGAALNSPEGFPNIEFVTLVDLEGSDLMFITDENNIEILEYIPQEKSVYRFEYLKRKTFVHADYRAGCAFVFSGIDLPKNSGFLGQAQFVYVNDAPAFSSNVYVPLYGRAGSQTSEINYNRLYVHSELLADVVKLEGLPAGTIVKIKGNTAMSSNKKIKKKTSGNGGNLDLTADFDPATGGTLTLLIMADKSYKEISRTNAPDAVPDAAVQLTGKVVDANSGKVFKYKGDAAATLENIIGGNEGAEITIHGQAANALTVAAVAGRITITGDGDAVLDAANKFITLKNFDGQWFEIARG